MSISEISMVYHGHKCRQHMNLDCSSIHLRHPPLVLSSILSRFQRQLKKEKKEVCHKREIDKNPPQEPFSHKSRRFAFIFSEISKILYPRAYFTYCKINIISLSALRQCNMRISINTQTHIHTPWIFGVATFSLFCPVVVFFPLCDTGSFLSATELSTRFTKRIIMSARGHVEEQKRILKLMYIYINFRWNFRISHHLRPRK